MNKIIFFHKTSQKLSLITINFLPEHYGFIARRSKVHNFQQLCFSYKRAGQFLNYNGTEGCKIRS